MVHHENCCCGKCTSIYGQMQSPQYQNIQQQNLTAQQALQNQYAQNPWGSAQNGSLWQTITSNSGTITSDLTSGPNSSGTTITLPVQGSSGYVYIDPNGKMQTTKGDKVELGVQKKIELGYGEEKGICPQCSLNNSSQIGNISIDGSMSVVRKCNNCYALYVKEDGGFKRLVDEAKEKFPNSIIGFVPYDTSTQENSSTNSNNDNKLDEIKRAMNNNRDSTDNVKYAIDNLLVEMRNIIQQNQKLMEKMTNDPLVNLKERVNKFSLT